MSIGSTYSTDIRIRSRLDSYAGLVTNSSTNYFSKQQHERGNQGGKGYQGGQGCYDEQGCGGRDCGDGHDNNGGGGQGHNNVAARPHCKIGHFMVMFSLCLPMLMQEHRMPPIDGKCTRNASTSPGSSKAVGGFAGLSFVERSKFSSFAFILIFIELRWFFT
jgi:hypothetical protein